MSNAAIEERSASAGARPRGVRKKNRPIAAWFRRRYAGSPRLLWTSNMMLLVTAGAWAFFDPGLHALFGGDELPEANWLDWHAIGFAAVFVVAGIQILWLFSGLWLGSTKFRELRSLGILLALIGMWLGYALNCQTISWRGRSWRLTNYVHTIEPLAKPLVRKWPKQDGEVEGLGPFMAYPVGRPTTLILLTPPRLSAGGPFVSAVEKSADGAIRFELSDAGGNDWLEWHPTAKPTSHIGGLLEHREMTRSMPLTKSWYLVRYHASS